MPYDVFQDLTPVKDVVRQDLAPVLALVVVLACGSSPSSPTSGAPALVHTSAHFTFTHTAAESASIQQIATTVEGEYDRIVGDLGAVGMPRVNVTFYANHAALVAGAGPSVGTIPPWANGLVSGVDRVHLVSRGSMESTATTIVHEFAHCVSLHVNAAIANNPRWLWETVAVYEARQFVDPRTLSYLPAQPPSLQQMNRMDDTQIYSVGFLIGEFIVERWGRDALRALVLARGDTHAALGISSAAFEEQWPSFVRARYGL